MFGNLGSAILLTYIVIGTIGVLTNIKVSSNYIGHRRGMWPIDPRSLYIYQQIKNQQPKTSRKMFWYNTHTPMLYGKLHLSNNMRALHVLPRYIQAGTENRGIMANTQRTSLLSANSALLPVNSMKYNIAETPVLTSTAPTTTKMTPSANYFKSNEKPSYSEYIRGTPSANYIQNDDKRNYSQYFKNEWTACPETKHSADCFSGLPNNYQKEYAANVADNAITITTTTLPYSNYITHTYFTLDDVIIPRTRHSFRYNLPIQKTLTTESDPETRIIPTTEMPTENYNFASKFIDFSPSTTVENTKQTVEPFIPILETRIEEVKISTPIPEETTQGDIDLLESSPNLTTTSQSIILPEIQHSSNSTKELCKNCRETSSNNMTNTLGGLRLKSVKDMRLKLKENYQNSLRIVNHNGTQKVNTTTYVLPRANHTRTQKKFRIMPSTKKTPLHTFPKVTETSKHISKRNKTGRIYLRRRVIEMNSTVLDNSTLVKNVTNETSTIKQHKRPVSINTRSPKKLVKETNLRNLTINSNSNIRLPTDGSPVEKVSLGTESAIMTISSGSPKLLHRSNLKHKSYQRNGNKINNLDYDNVVPPLPIEVYFKKANQN